MLTALVVALAVGVGSDSAHGVDFWRDLVRHQYQPPSGSDPVALARELSDLLASPDPELRDDIAYATLATWIYGSRILPPDAIRPLAERWVSNLGDRIGSTGTDDVLRRSFSALMLSVVVARDNAEPFLSADEFHRIESAGLAYLDAERDLRGYDPVKGWMHAAAHTADLLKFAGRSRYLEAAGQVTILDAIARKCAGAGVVFDHGEDERFARAVLSIVHRADFDADAFGSWTTRVRPDHPASPRPPERDLASIQNRRNLLAKLAVLLALEPESARHIAYARDSVLAALKDLF